jgi:glycosyltransferase involved in cell wall biosynthesis
MRVVHYRRSLGAHGGIEKYVSRVGAEQAGHGDATFIVAGSIAPGFDPDSTAVKVELREHMTPAGMAMPGVVPFLARARPNVVHVHSLSSLSAVVHFWGPWRRVLTPYFHQDIPESPYADAYRKRYRVAMRWAHSCVFMSSAEQAMFEDFVGVKCRRSAVVAPGVDPIVVDVGARTGVTAIARLVDYKRLDLVVEAASAAGVLDRLTIAGSGPEHDHLAAMIRQRGGDAGAVLVGSIADEQLQELLARTRVLVAMSESESYGITLAEGLAAGAAVIASDIPAHHQVVDTVDASHYALIDSDAAELARCLDAPPVAPPVGQYHRAWSTVAQELTEHYRSL